MTTDIRIMAPGSDVAEVARSRLRKRLRAIPIVEDQPSGGRLVGIITRRDLMRCLGCDDVGVAANVRHRIECSSAGLPFVALAYPVLGRKAWLARDRRWCRARSGAVTLAVRRCER